MSVRILHAERQCYSRRPSRQRCRLTRVEKPKIPIQAPAVALGPELRVPLPCDGLAVGEKRNEREQGVKADESWACVSVGRLV